MKKLMTLCFFAFAMFLGTQTSFAQSTIEINADAAVKTKELKQSLKLNNEVTEEKVYNIFQEYFHAKATLDQMKASGEEISEESIKKFNTFLITKFEPLFTQEQMQRYKTLTGSQN